MLATHADLVALPLPQMFELEEEVTSDAILALGKRYFSGELTAALPSQPIPDVSVERRLSLWSFNCCDGVHIPRYLFFLVVRTIWTKPW